MKLHIGCGRTILPGWVNVDFLKLPGVDVVADLDDCRSNTLPFENNSVDEILASHVLEHIKDILPLMQELWRISKNNSSMVIRVPHGASDDAWEDPTHVRAFFPKSFGYFSQPYYWRADYGYRGDWQPETVEIIPSRPMSSEDLALKMMSERNCVSEMVATLRSVKPSREPRRDLQVPPKIIYG